MNLLIISLSGDFCLLVKSGTRYWCNGVDLKWVRENPEKGPTVLDLFSRLLARLLVFKLPTIALINGHAVGAGMMLSMAFDYRIMSQEKGWIFLPAVNLSIVLPPSFFSLLKSKIGDGKVFREIVLTGRRYNGAEAKEVGIIDECSTSLELENAVFALAKKVVGKDSEAYYRLKRSMYFDVYNNLMETKVESDVFDKSHKSKL